MYNSEKPDLADLPSTARLLKSTALAAVAAVAILVTVVLPAEYGIDPTGAGGVLGLTEMGDIKSQLAEEAELDHQTSLPSTESSTPIINALLGLFINTAHAQDTEQPWTDEVTFTLEPGEGIEYKLVMQQDAEAQFLWSASGGRVNFDLHGDGDGQNISYEKGRGTTGEQGVLKAKFTGNHGWFWRNRDKQAVTVTLQVRGDYEALERQ